MAIQALGQDYGRLAERVHGIEPSVEPVDDMGQQRKVSGSYRDIETLHNGEPFCPRVAGEAAFVGGGGPDGWTERLSERAGAAWRGCCWRGPATSDWRRAS